MTNPAANNSAREVNKKLLSSGEHPQFNSDQLTGNKQVKKIELARS